MAYYSGSANDMESVRAALISACVADGWEWNSSVEVLSKGTVFIRLQIIGGYLEVLGRTSAASGDAPSVVRMGHIGSTEISWPAEYRLFIFSGEVYCVIKFNVDYYLWCAFGKSSVAGLPGTGNWVAASLHAASNNYLDLTPSSGAAQSHGYGVGAIFWRTNASQPDTNDFWLHSDFDDQGWLTAQSVADSPAGIQPLVPLIGLQPNAWNSEAVLLPIRCYKIRQSSKLSLTGDLENSRYIRLDHYSPDDVIALGEDRWMILPFYRKNAAQRDGGQQIDHSGTFGWAIRYEGA